jgi:acyl dehydratase
MSTTVFAKPIDLLGSVGSELGPTPWRTIDQPMIDRFADATGDHQWIHVDPDRASSGPYGSTIAHGYLTLSLAGSFVPELISVPGAVSTINCGCEKVRFISPVPVRSRLRGRASIVDANQIMAGVQLTMDVTIDLDGAVKPACVLRSILRYLD